MTFTYTNAAKRILLALELEEPVPHDVEKLWNEIDHALYDDAPETIVLGRGRKLDLSKIVEEITNSAAVYDLTVREAKEVATMLSDFRLYS